MSTSGVSHPAILIVLDVTTSTTREARVHVQIDWHLSGVCGVKAGAEFGVAFPGVEGAPQRSWEELLSIYFGVEELFYFGVEELYGLMTPIYRWHADHNKKLLTSGVK